MSREMIFNEAMAKEIVAYEMLPDDLNEDEVIDIIKHYVDKCNLAVLSGRKVMSIITKENEELKKENEKLKVEIIKLKNDDY